MLGLRINLWIVSFSELIDRGKKVKLSCDSKQKPSILKFYFRQEGAGWTKQLFLQIFKIYAKRNCPCSMLF